MDPLEQITAATATRQQAVDAWEQAIVSAVLALVPLRRIADAAGISHQGVTKLAARHGITIARNGRGYRTSVED